MRRLIAICMSTVLAGTTGCAGLRTAFGENLSLPRTPITDDRRALELWAQDLDTVRDGLRLYDLSGQTTQIRITLDKRDNRVAETITYGPGDYPNALEAYVRARQDQIDGLCSVFFNSLQNLSSTSRWGRDQVNAVAEFSSMMLGLGGAASKQLATLSGAQILFNDSYDAASAALLISADPYRVHRAVTNEQTRQFGRTTGSFANFREAEAFVRQYAEPCTLMGVQRLISEALDTQAITTPADEASLELRLRALAATLNSGDVQNASPIDVAGLDSNTLQTLYRLLRLQPGDAETQAALEVLSDPMKARVAALTAPQSPLRLALQAQMDAIDQMSPSVGRAAHTAQAAYQEAQRAKAESAIDASAASTGAVITGEVPEQD